MVCRFRVDVNGGRTVGTVKEEVVCAGRLVAVKFTGCAVPFVSETVTSNDADCPWVIVTVLALVMVIA